LNATSYIKPTVEPTTASPSPEEPNWWDTDWQRFPNSICKVNVQENWKARTQKSFQECQKACESTADCVAITVGVEASTKQNQCVLCRQGNSQLATSSQELPALLQAEFTQPVAWEHEPGATSYTNPQRRALDLPTSIFTDDASKADDEILRLDLSAHGLDRQNDEQREAFISRYVKDDPSTPQLIPDPPKPSAAFKDLPVGPDLQDCLIKFQTNMKNLEGGITGVLRRSSVMLAAPAAANFKYKEKLQIIDGKTEKKYEYEVQAETTHGFFKRDTYSYVYLPVRYLSNPPQYWDELQSNIFKDKDKGDVTGGVLDVTVFQKKCHTESTPDKIAECLSTTTMEELSKKYDTSVAVLATIEFKGKDDMIFEMSWVDDVDPETDGLPDDETPEINRANTLWLEDMFPVPFIIDGVSDIYHVKYWMY